MGPEKPEEIFRAGTNFHCPLCKAAILKLRVDYRPDQPVIPDDLELRDGSTAIPGTRIVCRGCGYSPNSRELIHESWKDRLGKP